MMMARPPLPGIPKSLQQRMQGMGGKGGEQRRAFNQQLMNTPGFADSVRDSLQRAAQDPNANRMRLQGPQGPQVRSDQLPGGPRTMPPGVQQAQQLSFEEFMKRGGAGARMDPALAAQAQARAMPPQPFDAAMAARMQQFNQSQMMPPPQMGGIAGIFGRRPGMNMGMAPGMNMGMAPGMRPPMPMGQPKSGMSGKGGAQMRSDQMSGGPRTAPSYAMR